MCAKVKERWGNSVVSPSLLNFNTEEIQNAPAPLYFDPLLGMAAPISELYADEI